MYFRLPTGSDGKQGALFDHFPAWMPQTWHLLHFVGILKNFTRFGCSVAPMLPVDCWAVLREGSEASTELGRLDLKYQRHEKRNAYNTQQLTLARESRKTTFGTLWGLTDIYVPVVKGGRCDAMVVAGPFLTELPSATQLIERWVELAGAPTSPYDPGLLGYARAVLDLDVVEPRELEALVELLEMLARALVGESDLPRDLDRASELRENVLSRGFQSVGRGARLLVEKPIASNALEPWKKVELGIEHYPNAVVALMPREQEKDRDPVSSLVAAQEFQRACFRVHTRFPNTLPFALDEYGACFLMHEPQSKNPARARLAILDRSREIAAAVERELGLSVALGVGGHVSHALELAECVRRSVLALQLAIHKDEKEYVYEASAEAPAASSLRPARLLNQLTRMFSIGTFGEFESVLGEYIRVVLWRSGGRITRIRMHFEAALESVLDALGTYAELGEETQNEAHTRALGEIERAGSSRDLVNAFRNALRSMTRVHQHPRRGELELRLARAARFIDEHCNETLVLETVAHHVGLSPNYFSEQFKLSQKVSFSLYLRRARVERAKYLLRNSPAAVHRVSDECGFASIPHFNRVFKDLVGVTPSKYRSNMGAGSARSVAQ
jgi:AraC-like DNA-binding protein